MEVVNREEFESKLTERKEAEEEVFYTPDEEEEEDALVDEEEEESVKEKGIFTLRNPIYVDGEKVEKLRYDFTEIKPVQYINIVKRVAKKENVQVPELNMSIQFNMFCKAAGVPVAILKTEVQRVDEFTAMCQLARDFLLSKQGEEDEVL